MIVAPEVDSRCTTVASKGDRKSCGVCRVQFIIALSNGTRLTSKHG
jgi:hypothetical protein